MAKPASGPRALARGRVRASAYRRNHIHDGLSRSKRQVTSRPVLFEDDESGLAVLPRRVSTNVTATNTKAAG